VSAKPRTSIVLSEPQLAFLRAEAAGLGITLGELVRRIVDQHRARAAPGHRLTRDANMAYSDVTGRDGYLIAQALHEAIKTLSALPDIERPESHIAEMRRILFTNFSGLVPMFVAQDDAKAALAELPPEASDEARAACLREVSEQWNERSTG
jgi:hypothetical protein